MSDCRPLHPRIARSSDVHEASYLPFIFSARDGDASKVDTVDLTVRKMTGRRVFNKQGQEVTMEVMSIL